MTDTELPPACAPLQANPNMDADERKAAHREKEKEYMEKWLVRLLAHMQHTRTHASGSYIYSQDSTFVLVLHQEI